MNRRQALAGVALAAIGGGAMLQSANAVQDYQAEWVNVLTGQDVPGMCTSTKRVDLHWRDLTFEVFYLFPAGPVPCIVAIHPWQWEDWNLMQQITTDDDEVTYTEIDEGIVHNNC
ncbi:MAG: hypothetical protein M3Z20_18230 [Chloroflexota bacterium]|nr:hypothetical protein [Chloroflexota bacterium]